MRVKSLLRFGIVGEGIVIFETEPEQVGTYILSKRCGKYDATRIGRISGNGVADGGETRQSETLQPYAHSGLSIGNGPVNVAFEDTDELAMAEWFERDKMPVEAEDLSLTNEMMMAFKHGKV